MNKYYLLSEQDFNEINRLIELLDECTDYGMGFEETKKLRSIIMELKIGGN